MKTVRVFTVEVRNCKNCNNVISTNLCKLLWGIDRKQSHAAHRAYSENYKTITPSCPRYAESKLIKVKDTPCY